MKYFFLWFAFVKIALTSNTQQQHVKFLPGDESKLPKKISEKNGARTPRSFFHFPTDIIELPPNWPVDTIFTQHKVFNYYVEKNNHITPDFSNGLGI